MKRILKQADIDEIKAYLIGGQFPGNLTKSKRQSFARKANQYKLIDNELYLANSGTSMMTIAKSSSGLLLSCTVPSTMGCRFQIYRIQARARIRFCEKMRGLPAASTVEKSRTYKVDIGRETV